MDVLIAVASLLSLLLVTALAIQRHRHAESNRQARHATELHLQRAERANGGNA